jgi:hypothetical protein
MKKSRFTDNQIVAVLKQTEAGTPAVHVKLVVACLTQLFEFPD